MDPVAYLVAEYVVHEPVLGDPGESPERRRRNNRVEVVAVTGHHGSRIRDLGLDARLQLVGGS